MRCYFIEKVSSEHQTELANVPDVISIFEERFSLVGAIAFENKEFPPGVQSNGHYTALVKTSNSWIKFDDLQKSSNPFNSKNAITIASLLYVKLNNQ